MKVFRLYFILLLTLLSINILAQEVIVELRDEKPAGDGKVIIYSDGDVISVGDKNAPIGKMQVEIYKENSGNEEGKVRVGSFQQDGEFKERQDKNFSQGEPKINREQKMSSEAMKSPEAIKKTQEKIESNRNESIKTSNETNKPSEEPKRENARPGGRSSSADDGIKRYMDAVVNKNLFLPLGSGAEEKKSLFAVTALITTPKSSVESENKAIIQELGSNKGYYVSEGDSFAGNVKVLEIDDNLIKLNRSGEEMTLKLGEGTTGRGGGARGGGGKAAGSQGGDRAEVSKTPEKASRSDGSDFDASQIPPFAMEILKQRGISIDDLRNNADLREKLRKEFTERFGGGGGQQPAMMLQDRLDNRERGRRNR